MYRLGEMDWIQGDKFVGVAKWVYSPNNRAKYDYNPLLSNLNLNLLKDGDIVYTHGLYLELLFRIMASTHKQYILVSHNSDLNVDDSLKWGGNLLHWFTQNVNVDRPCIESIPIGLENDCWFKTIKKKEKMEIKLTHSTKGG